MTLTRNFSNGATQQKTAAASTPTDTKADTDKTEQMLMQSTVRLIQTGWLHIDRSYQRALSPNKVKRIVKEFDPYIFDPLLVGVDGSGLHWVVDGQHRLEAARQLNIPELECRVFPMDQALQALEFNKANTNVTLLLRAERWNARRIAGEPVVKEIDAIVAEFGLTLAVSRSDYKFNADPHVLGAFETVERIYQHFGAHMLRQVLQVLTTAYPNEARALRGMMLGGLATFLRVYKGTEQFDMARLHWRLTQTPIGSMLSDAATFHRIHGGSREVGVAGQLVEVYNYRLHDENRLDATWLRGYHHTRVHKSGN